MGFVFLLIILVSAILVALTTVPLVRYSIGSVGNLGCLKPKITYHVTAQALTDDGQYTIIVKNATGKGQSRWVKIPNSLSPDVILVKVVEDEKGKRELVPLMHDELKKADRRLDQES